MWIIALFGGLLLPSVLGQCNYQQYVNTTGVNVFSPNYPGYYVANTQCTWLAVATPSNYRLRLTCSNVQIPDGTNGCPNDWISISRTGRTDFADGYKYCGYGTFNEESTGNQMSIKLFAQYYSPGGQFLCQIQAFQPTTTIPTVPYDPCNCGVRKTSRIVGGTAAGVNEFPFQAALVSNTTRSIFCGAEIISNRRALTARHCLAGQSPSLVGLLVGDSDTSTGSDTPYTSLYLIQAFTCFGGNCNTNDQANDIAMVLTVNQIQMNPGVNIICLPIKYNTNTANQFAGTKVVAAGWGDTEFGGIGSNTLQKVTLDVITTAQCQSRYGNSITVNHICTSTFGRDTCQRDSGTSLMYTGTDNGRMYTVGVVSFGVECGTNPSVSTRVTSYVNWIRSNSPESSYCSV